MAKTVTTTVREEHIVTRTDILCAMRAKGINVPDDADVIVRVPGGGDWSNMDLHVHEAPVIVRFSETKTTNE